MPKIDLTDLASLTNEQSAIASINANYATIETESDSFLSRDGTSPNQMEADLDMNSNRILNLPAPTTDNEPARLVDVGNAAGYAEAAEASAEAAAESETNAATSASSAATSASSASTSATAASTSATEAAASATSAEASATSAEANASVVVGTKWSWETSTSMAAPATGGLRANNAAPSSITALALSASSADSGNPDVSDWITTWDDSTATVKGTLLIRKIGAPSQFLILNVSAVTDNTTWLQLTVSHVQNNAGWSFSAADSLTVQFFRTGDKGADGAVAGPGSSVDNEIALWNGTSGTTLKRASTTGILKATSGVISAAVSGTDYAPATTGSSILKASSGGFANAVSGTDYAPATSGSAILKGNGSGGFSSATAGTDYLSPSSGGTLTVGFTATSFNIGNISSGTVTLNAANGPIQHYSNSGAHTLAPPTNPCCIIVELTNSGSGGAITTSGFSVVSGDTYSSTGTKKYIIHVVKTNSYSQAHFTYVTGT